MRGNRPVLLVFIDGLGMGRRDPATNPLAHFEPKVLRVFRDSVGPFPCQGRCLVTDTGLGVEGLPQSATGQTALWTGCNAARILGRHLPAFPNQPLRQLIRDHSLFRHLKRGGFEVTFANTYLRAPRWKSVTTVMCETSNTPLRGLEHLLREDSLFMDFSNRILQERGLEVPLRSPAEAARILVDLASRCDLCLYEYFLTDWVGHRGDMPSAVELLKKLDDFLSEIVSRLDLDQSSLAITSDHGNIEQMDRKQHTTNPVATLLWGPIRERVLPGGQPFSLTDLSPLVRDFLTAGTG